MWDFEPGDTTYSPVLKAMTDYIKSCGISGVYETDIIKNGVHHNFEQTESGQIKYDHFYIELPERFVSRTYELGEKINQKNTDKLVFESSLSKLTLESAQTVLDLIEDKNLYRGIEYKYLLELFKEKKSEYDSIKDQKQKELYLWETSSKIGSASRIKNTAIGTILENLSDGIALDDAIFKFENVMDPDKFKRKRPVYTERQLENMKNRITELGYLNSLPRRFGKIDDISVNNILFYNKDASYVLPSGDIFDTMKSDIPKDPKKIRVIEEVQIDEFIKNILPDVTYMEALMESNHTTNLVSLIAPKNKESKSMFRWDNGFSWAYKGNITDSAIKRNVEKAGGDINGVLRFSIQWNDGNIPNYNDFDAHCIEPNNFMIFFGEEYSNKTHGKLDVDIRYPDKGQVAVENITYPSTDYMTPGEYKFYVNNYANRGGSDGFSAELECNGQIYSFTVRRPIQDREMIHIVTVKYSKENGFEVEPIINSTVNSKEVWGIKTHQFIPVSTVMYSPNYWDGKVDEIKGNLHYFFMLKGCMNPETPNGFYNEFLKNELLTEKSAFEALGAKLAVEQVDEQLSGLGFSSTRRNSLIVKIKIDSNEKILKILF
jgi:hypothetical protein